MTDDARRYAPSATRNRDIILKTLSKHLPARGNVLEIASGTGEHVMHIAAAHPGLIFQPSDPDPDSRASIDAWIHHLGVKNVAPAIQADIARSIRLPNGFDVIICINMIHIAPWSAAVGLMRNAAAMLPTGGLLYLYGPYRRGGNHTAASNEAFDADLKTRNLEWGVRDLEAVAAVASDHGFSAPVVEEMPANNLSVVFRKL